MSAIHPNMLLSERNEVFCFRYKMDWGTVENADFLSLIPYQTHPYAFFGFLRIPEFFRL